MAAAIVPVEAAKKMSEKASDALKLDLFVLRKTYPAKYDKKGQLEEPEKNLEIHGNAGGLLALMAALAVGAVGAVFATVAWNGVHWNVLGSDITIIKGAKDDVNAWKKKRELFAMEKARCEAQGGKWIRDPVTGGYACLKPIKHGGP